MEEHRTTGRDGERKRQTRLLSSAAVRRGHARSSKYGGTSVADADRIRHVARRVLKRIKQGDQVIVVVSAMSSSTDDLIDLALQVAPDPGSTRARHAAFHGEQVSVALVAMALKTMGQEAVGLTGGRPESSPRGSTTRGGFRRSKRTSGGRAGCQARVPVVAGYWGVNEDQEILTLGRGASAPQPRVALAVALGRTG
ncbi:MAG: hypothetical protein IPF51_16335 [Dehalococcoidia bacterium]|nr:hypothetical protein [Dehalococcoidia bacterium]